MPLLAKVARPREQKFNPAFGAILTSGLRAPAWTSANYTALANEGYVQNTDVYACVDVKAKAFAGVPWKVLRRRRKADPEELPDHPLAQLIKRPNESEGSSAFFEKASAFQDLAGNTFLYRFNLKNQKQPRELWCLRPDRTKIIQSGNPVQPILRYEYQSVQVINFEPDKSGHIVGHWKTFHPIDDWYGLSPIQVASRAVDQSNGAQAWNASLFQNACVPSGVLQGRDAKLTLTQTQFDRLQDKLRREYGGSVNAGLPMLLEGGLEWKQMGLSPVDVAWLEGDTRATEKIARAFGVPIELIGARAKGGLNDANFVQARKQFYLETMLPALDKFRDFLNFWLVPLYDDDALYLDYDRDEIEAIQEDREIIHARARDNVKAGLWTVNEARVETGKDPIPGGDVRMIPNTILQIDQNGVVVEGTQPPIPLPTSAPALPGPANKPPKKLPAPAKKMLAIEEDPARAAFAAIAASQNGYHEVIQ